MTFGFCLVDLVYNSRSCKQKMGTKFSWGINMSKREYDSGYQSYITGQEIFALTISNCMVKKKDIPRKMWHHKIEK